MRISSGYFKRKYNYSNRRKKYTAIILAMICFFGVGYAYLNTMLNISGIAILRKSTWDVHFENILKINGNVDVSNDVKIVDDTNISFTADLSEPGSVYSFSVDIVNDGTIDAMLGELLKIGLTVEQEEYAEYNVTYLDGEEILAKDSLPSGKSDTILVTVKYKEDSLLTEDQTVDLSLESIYMQDDGTSNNRRPAKPLLYNKVVEQNIVGGVKVLDNQSSTYVSASTGINFGAAPSDTNGKGLYVRSGTESDTYPIYYYRGDVKNNNVIFGGFCWKIVRTTETGGVKLVYNGVPTEGKCNNTGTASQLSTISEFNVTSDSQNAAHVGYMYGNPSGATYSDIHTNTKASTSSTIKKVIDTWYSNNLINYTNYLEDTVWCNDRSLYSGTGVGTTTTEYGGYGRLYGNSPAPSLICANKNDKFTVSDIDNGNGALIYPVALLTADELTLAGNGYTGYSSSTYLWTGESYWTMTPSNSFSLALEMYIDDNGKLDDVTSVATTFGVRPVLSIKYGTRVEEGNGTSDSPFIIIAEETNYLYDEIVLQNLENGVSVFDNTSSTYVSASTGINFGTASSTTNGKGVYVRSGTEVDKYPVYYYRGDVTNNNVIFAGFCWKIVRTTATGGIKLIYNGVPSDGQCNNTGTLSQLNTVSEFNYTESNQNAAYVGYMYGNVSGSTYSAIHTSTRASNSSTIKTAIDTWYSGNMTDYTTYLEDEMWCNDRSLYSGTGVGTTTTEYGAYGRLRGSSPTPSLVCANKNDTFTVNNLENGNSALTYPVALLTADELTLAGNGYTGYSNSTYLWTGESYWTMTPSNSFSLALEMYIDDNGKLDDVTSVATTFGVRPAISLKNDTKISITGNGSSSSPFIVNN